MRLFVFIAVLNIVSARAYPRATEHVDAIEAMVNGLLERNFAYEEGGSVYFRVKAFASYGCEPYSISSSSTTSSSIWLSYSVFVYLIL